MEKNKDYFDHTSGPFVYTSVILILSSIFKEKKGHRSILILKVPYTFTNTNNVNVKKLEPYWISSTHLPSENKTVDAF